MTVRASTLGALAACHFGGTAVTSDALLAPPDGDTACGSPIAFLSWTYSMHAITGFTQPIAHPTFLTADVAVFESNGRLFQSGTDGTATPISSLDLPDDSMLQAPSAAPGGNVFWFVRLGGTSGGVYAAVRSGDDWIATRAQLGPDASYFEPGAAAFYAGSVRMVVAAGNGQVGLLRELASADGIAWTVVADIDMPELADPALSPDGCQLLVSAVVGTGTRAIYVANRQPDGTFGMPVPTSMVMGADVGGPALDPTQSRLWFVDGGQLVQGTP